MISTLTRLATSRLSFSSLASHTSPSLRSAAFACKLRPASIIVAFLSTMSLVSSSSAASPSAAATTPAFLSAKTMKKQLNQPLLDPAFVVQMSSKPIIQHHDSSSVPSLADSIVSSEDFTGKSLWQTLEVDGRGTPAYRPWIVGHRGALFQELENTREGFRACATMGCDAVELDVFLLKCGSLIVFHGGGADEDPGLLLDYCGRQGSILDLTMEEALQLTFNPEYAEFPCPKHSILSGSIPTLEQVLLDAKESGLHVKIELKGEGTVEPSLELVERLGMVDQCSYSCFDLERIALLRQLRPQTTETGEYVYKTGALFSDVPADFLEQAKRVGASEIHLKYDTCTSSIVSQIHNAGFGSMCWFRGPIGMTEDCLEKYWDVGNEDETMYEAMWKTGVQQLCLNKPDVMIALRKQTLQEMEQWVA